MWGGVSSCRLWAGQRSGQKAAHEVYVMGCGNDDVDDIDNDDR